MEHKRSLASISYIDENGEETPIDIANVSNLEMSDKGEPAMVPNPLPKAVGGTITMQIAEVDQKVYNRLKGIILLHHRRN